MPKLEGKSTKQIGAIREYSRQGLSANEIQRRLSRQGMGMRRTVMLQYVREFKRQTQETSVSKNVPYKYRLSFSFGGKHVAVYSTVRGKQRRIQVYGNGKQLRRVMVLVSRHPPKQRFLTIDAASLLSNPWRYLSEGFWDEKPQIES